MKTVFAVILIIIAFLFFAGLAYYAIPLLIVKETSGLRSEVQDLKQRLQKIEEESKVAPLQPDADAQKIIKTVNALSLKLSSLEDSFKKGISTTDEAIKKQKATTEEAFKKQTEAIDKIAKETEAKIQRSMFNALLASIRGHILKVKVDVVSKNIGTAKTELDLISETFEKAKALSTDENKKIIDEFQGLLKKAKAEIDTNLPAAINRIDLLWHDMSKLLRKS